jgi:hypothetical protein
MDYLNFTLVFGAIMLLFELGWILIALILMIIFRAFKSIKMIKIGMYIEKALYCFFIISSTVLTIEIFREKNSSLIFLIFMILLSLIYFVFFFADKRENAKKSRKDEIELYKSIHIELTRNLILIENAFIFSFIPLIFFSNIISNNLTLFVFEGLYYITTIKVLGVVLGILGIFSLVKYIKMTAFSLFILPMLNRNGKDR